jgi:hypothetical protein
MTTDKIKITMSERRPITIDPKLWPVIARADWHNGQHEFQANTIRRIKVRQHADGRRIVYGFQTAGNGGQPIGTRNPAAGFLLPAGADTIRAIRRVGGVIDDDTLADECIADLPAEELVNEASRFAEPGMRLDVSADKLGAIYALLVRAAEYVPEPLKSEIRAAITAGAS